MPDIAKGVRFNFRWSAEQSETIRQAAHEAGMTPSDFVRESAFVAAHRILADRTSFALSPEEWRAFSAALDHPAVNRPRLRRLMTQPSVLDK